MPTFVDEEPKIIPNIRFQILQSAENDFLLLSLRGVSKGFGSVLGILSKFSKQAWFTIEVLRKDRNNKVIAET